MMEPLIGPRIARAAREMIGAPFRLHGRVPETGLDCVGLCLAALRAAGHDAPAPSHYTLRGARAAHAAHLLRAAGLVPAGVAGPGDLLVARSGPLQLHLMIADEACLIHAHAGLGRVVEMPAPGPWPILSRWAVAGRA